MKRLAMPALALAACQAVTTDNFQNPPPGPPAACAQIAAPPGCDDGSLGYTCGSGARPDDGDASIVCSSGVPGALGAVLFCCAPFSQTSTECVPAPALAGCGGWAIGFSCTGGVTPSDADPAIACSADLGSGAFCCNTARPIATCAIDPSVACAGVGAGYSCADGTAPPLGSAFACTLVGSAAFCCSPTDSAGSAGSATD